VLRACRGRPQEDGRDGHARSVAFRLARQTQERRRAVEHLIVRGQAVGGDHGRRDLARSQRRLLGREGPRVVGQLCGSEHSGFVVILDHLEPRPDRVLRDRELAVLAVEVLALLADEGGERRGPSHVDERAVDLAVRGLGDRARPLGEVVPAPGRVVRQRDAVLVEHGRVDREPDGSGARRHRICRAVDPVRLEQALVHRIEVDLVGVVVEVQKRVAGGVLAEVAADEEHDVRRAAGGVFGIELVEVAADIGVLEIDRDAGVLLLEDVEGGLVVRRLLGVRPCHDGESDVAVGVAASGGIDRAARHRDRREGDR
jgi:hypothetical protein